MRKLMSDSQFLAILRLKELGWGAKQISRELGIMD
jgi:hypothetical protein